LSTAHDDIEQLHAVMVRILAGASKQAQLDLINAHPDLAGKAAVEGKLTRASASEQAGVGIDQCTAEEFARFTELNDAHKARFRFPFIMAVKGSNRHQILAAFEERIHHDYDTEFACALKEINKIALFRLLDL
jgi:2-oxo-4-hydroxy-4-carboxy-5-ureidoimidazoline decarboxylase